MDDLERELRDASPLTTRRDSPLSARAELELSALVDASPDAAPADAAPAKEGRSRRRWAAPAIGFAAATAMAVTLAVVLAVTNFGQAPPASNAEAPPILEATPLGESLDEVLTRLSKLASAQGGDASAAQLIRYEAWSAQIEADAPTSTYYVQPEEIEKRWSADLSGSFESRAGDIRYGKPSPDNPPVAPGTVLRHDEYAPGQYQLTFVDAPPDDAAELDAYLRSTWGLPDEAAAVDYFGAIEGLRLERSLTGAETAAALDLLAGLPDVSLAGSVTDRLGREGIALQSEKATGTHRMLLIFSPDTGMLLSTETMYLGGIPDLSLEYPTVINYYAWKD